MDQDQDQDDQAELGKLLDLVATGRGGIEHHDDDALARLRSDLPSPSSFLRVLIAVIALSQLVLVIPWLIGLDPFDLLRHGGDGHLTRDGSLGLIVAIAGLLTSWRPRWALPSFVISLLALVAQGLGVLVDDTIQGLGLAELIHVPSIVLVAMVGLAANRLTPLGPRRRQLHAVTSESSPNW